jgi:hypothetical protein
MLQSANVAEDDCFLTLWDFEEQLDRKIRAHINKDLIKEQPACDVLDWLEDTTGEDRARDQNLEDNDVSDSQCDIGNAKSPPLRELLNSLIRKLMVSCDGESIVLPKERFILQQLCDIWNMRFECFEHGFDDQGVEIVNRNLVPVFDQTRRRWTHMKQECRQQIGLPCYQRLRKAAVATLQTGNSQDIIKDLRHEVNRKPKSGAAAHSTSVQMPHAVGPLGHSFWDTRATSNGSHGKGGHAGKPYQKGKLRHGEFDPFFYVGASSQQVPAPWCQWIPGAPPGFAPGLAHPPSY